MQGRGGQDVLRRPRAQGQGRQDQERVDGAEPVQVPVPPALHHPEQPC